MECNRLKPGIKRAAVKTVPGGLIGNRIIACVSAADGKKLEKRKLLNHCAKRTPKYMISAAIELRQKFPTTSADKIDRKPLIKEALVKHVHQNCHSKAI